MNKKIINRILNESEYIIKHNETVRETSKVFNVSKSTVHKDMKERLKLIDKDKYNKVIEIFDYHKEIRHINGGEATKQKFLKLKKL